MPMQEEFKPLVKQAQGFEYRPERPARTSVLAQKWGWSGLQPGVRSPAAALLHHSQSSHCFILAQEHVAAAAAAYHT